MGRRATQPRWRRAWPVSASLSGSTAADGTSADAEQDGDTPRRHALLAQLSDGAVQFGVVEIDGLAAHGSLHGDVVHVVPSRIADAIFDDLADTARSRRRVVRAE